MALHGRSIVFALVEKNWITFLYVEVNTLFIGRLHTNIRIKWVVVDRR